MLILVYMMMSSLESKIRASSVEICCCMSLVNSNQVLVDRVDPVNGPFDHLERQGCKFPILWQLHVLAISADVGADVLIS
jgi:hypothetical protein